MISYVCANDGEFERMCDEARLGYRLSRIRSYIQWDYFDGVRDVSALHVVYWESKVDLFGLTGCAFPDRLLLYR
tara:strand:- start:37 stop:258 length:222 start_codon:yes stop_codon:yes gene_type:complete